MTETLSLAEKWDAKYETIDPKQPVNASWLLKHHLKHLPLKGRGLELACGLGGNARLMAQCGLHVDAWDISDVALTHLNNWATVNQLPIFVSITNFEQMLFPFQQYDTIVVSRYLNRDLFTQIAQALKPGGKLFYQTFLAPVQDQAPNNPDYYIRSGEFSQAWPKFTTEVYGEGWLKDGDNTHRYAWYIGTKK